MSGYSPLQSGSGSPALSDHTASEAAIGSTSNTETGVLTPRRFRGMTIEAHSSSTSKHTTITNSPEDTREVSSFDSILSGDLGTAIEEELGIRQQQQQQQQRQQGGILGRLFNDQEGEYYPLEPMDGAQPTGWYRRRPSEPIWNRKMVILPVVLFAAMGIAALLISSLAWVRERIENPAEKVDSQLFPATIMPSQLGKGQYALRLVHTNDIHAHIEPFDAATGDACDPQAPNASAQCVGGAAYVKAVVDHLRGGAGVHDAVLVDAGDAVQGTAFDMLFAGNASLAVANTLRYDAVSLGNHELDRGLDHLVQYLNKLRSPVLCANLDFTREFPALQAAVQPFTVIEKHKLGIIGVLTPDAAESSSMPPGMQLTDPIAAVNAARARLLKMHISRIVVLSHLGFDADRHLAERVDPGIALIVGGHTHSYLGSDKASNETAAGPYPTWVANGAGTDWQTAIVQAKSFGQYVGYLDMVFNDDGSLDSQLTRGSSVPVAPAAASSPVHGIAPSQRMNSVISPFIRHAHEVMAHQVGTAAKAFAAPASARDPKELALGNLVTDALVWAIRHAPIALVNTGLLRAPLPAGHITRGDLLAAMPFDGSLVMANVSGSQLYEMLARASSSSSGALSTVQYSGVRVAANNAFEVRESISYDTRPFAGEQWKPLADAHTYDVLMPRFVAEGGDAISSSQLAFHAVSGRLSDLVELYITRFSPIAPILDHRK
ncbi:hypothetical protein LPJ79_005699 [Coemansia sp. RSA 1821]|nr:hypothetical protein LPJ79_005699 [Coemansia sp. RSA 1821]